MVTQRRNFKNKERFVGAATPALSSAAFSVKSNPFTMDEQTEKAFLKQPKVFLSSKKTGKGKRPGKGGNRFWKSI
ncbi:hypothetical protein PHAVU_011G106900 [Phaseolus vulgaris]|uniref:Uncharacterized protein n=1 Tax=Phaseolus vulgaris TaxID=3885 RepID=V7AH36_PHAVU|nr:hypothetical protein PHAVU_011G106900g [Phaseolus vulgaris]ESW04575.1 hypothetical protein PHAVU_011G106900g [Phaseolus vulgaris]